MTTLLGAALAEASGATAATGAAAGPLTAFSILAGRIGWGFFAAGAELFFSGTAETFLAGAVFTGALMTFEGFAARGGAPFFAGALDFAAGFFATGFGAAFLAAGFFAATLGLAFFATGLAAFFAGVFFAAAMVCLSSDSGWGNYVSVRGTLPDP